eukprot:CAMPEP_0176498880 /NCGR_PEP_ID=MMETSP0200_2-20121128/12597_1 /TAXON_ID=947934 /ORGANISM="Chaetoceros sp., Strain GSL56" /LENGTH=415 /DNA_ID=CAMNT_0017897197 /DNA_START=82 /DNA_END=1327 /DNA_ORIENTATION=+
MYYFLFPGTIIRAYIPHRNTLGGKYGGSNGIRGKQQQGKIAIATSSFFHSCSGFSTGTSTTTPIPHLGASGTHPTTNIFRIRGGGDALHSSSSTTTQLAFALSPSLASLLSGSIAGAIGVGVAFPLDTLKTKSQVLGRTNGGAGAAGSGGSNAQIDIGRGATVGGGSASAAAAISTAGTSDVAGAASSKMSMFQLIQLIYRTEGVAGFFGGVKGMMVGQAIIKSVAFSANASALAYLHGYIVLPSVVSLLLAACFSGFVTSFLVTPIERIKVLMQSSNVYKNEIDCLRAIIKNDEKGILGVLGKGLGPTLAREVPSYGIYFLIYGLLMQLPLATDLGVTAPLIFGALTGMASWIPVYPVDVVKTLVQTSDGSEDISAWEVTVKLYQECGIGAFFDGLTPKMLRAAVNHSVTFFIY